MVSSESGDSGLITGYYEPIIDGSRTRATLHRYPIFGVPDDLVVVDLGTRQPRDARRCGCADASRAGGWCPTGRAREIDARGDVARRAGASRGARDPVELFFLQIQGSGQVRARTNGERIRVGYADQNGHPYRSLGRHLVERGELLLEQASMQGIKAWAAANPAKLQEALNQNPSYVFFRELPDRPTGRSARSACRCIAERSLAVDRRFVPLGAPVYLATTCPLSEQPLERLMAAQDTGGAIRGAVRARLLLGNRPRRRRAGRAHAPAGPACGCCGRPASRCRARSSSVLSRISSAAQAAGSRARRWRGTASACC